MVEAEATLNGTNGVPLTIGEDGLATAKGGGGSRTASRTTRELNAVRGAACGAC